MSRSMSERDGSQASGPSPPTSGRTTIPLEDGARVGVVGGGPAGSLFAYFLLSFASRMELNLVVDIYEPRDFTKPGPAGCNMCGGIVSESLVQALAIDGINLPSSVVQRGIDSYVLHTDAASIRIDTPLHERRIAALHRGGGPRDVSELKWGGLDGYLLTLAQSLGATVVPVRVSDVGWDNGRPQVRLPDAARTYDLLVGATGVNSSGWQLFEKLGLPSKRYETTKAYITEIRLGNEAITRHFGNSMHMFLMNLPRLDCAAIIPKGDFLTVCLLGEDIDKDLIAAFFDSPAVKRCFPDAWTVCEGACHCSPKINIREASRPFMDRVVLLGDCGATRLYKDGIGAAYRTAKASARTAAFAGVSAENFRRHYWPVYRSIARDNRCGLLLFAVVHWIKAIGPLLRGVMRMSAREQAAPSRAKRMSIVLWDMFTGSAPYREILVRTVDPRFLGRLVWESALAVRGARRTKGRTAYG
jgi:flavin-dependent dehydrogenase